MAKLEFTGPQRTQSLTLRAASEIFTNCRQVNVARIVCGERFINYRSVTKGLSLLMAAGEYEFTCMDNCSDCWMCIEESRPPNAVGSPFEHSYRASVREIGNDTYTPTIKSPVSIWGISKPECCELTVKTAVGTVVIPASTTNYTAEFNQDVDLRPITLSGACLTQTTLFVQHP